MKIYFKLFFFVTIPSHYLLVAFEINIQPISKSTSSHNNKHKYILRYNLTLNLNVKRKISKEFHNLIFPFPYQIIDITKSLAEA